MKSITVLALFIFLSLNISAQERCITMHPAQDRYATYSPDGSKILFESDRNGNWDIFIMDADGNNLSALVKSGLNERRPFWHPDGNSIVFEIPEKNLLVELEISSGKENVILSEKDFVKYGISGKMQFPRYSPKKELLTFTLMENDTVMNLLVLDRENNTLEEVFVNPYRTAYASWNSKSNRIVFFSRHDTNNQIDDIYEIQLKGNNIRRLTNSPHHSFCPSYSPNDKKIVYVESMPGSRPELFIMNKDGKDKKRLTFNEDGETLPCWSPDGTKILFTAFRNGNFEICELEIEP